MQRLGQAAKQTAQLRAQEDFSKVRACKHPACML